MAIVLSPTSSWLILRNHPRGQRYYFIEDRKCRYNINAVSRSCWKITICLCGSFGSSRLIRNSSKNDGLPPSPDMEVAESENEKIARLSNTVQTLQARIAELECALSKAKLDNKGRETKKVFKKQSLRKKESPTKPAAGVISPVEKNLELITAIDNIKWPSPNDKVPFWKQRTLERRQIPEEGTVKQDSNPLHIVHVTAEMAPIAKVGGLGDVVTGLGRACIRKGHDVTVMLPFYECISKDHVEDLVSGEIYSSYHKGEWVSVQAHRGKVAGVNVILIEPKNIFFKGPHIYGGSYNELEAYLFFSRACLEWMQVVGYQPDIIHVHEWHIGALPILYWDMYHHLSLKKPRLMLTIHNMEHYGECRVEQLNMCGLDGFSYRVEDKAIDERTIGHNPERLSLLKGGIVYSNIVTTVSPTYVNETLCSGWLSGTLMKHRSKYSGVLNGIDTELWNPATDPFLPMGFDSKKLIGKQICKQFVQRGLGLDPDNLSVEKTFSEGARSPLIVCICRLVAQKGIHLIRHAMYRIQETGGQFVLLGTAPDPHVQREFERNAEEFKDSNRVKLLLTYSEALAHVLYAAADIILVPSMFEPCGLTQMIGMRYGAIPVVRKTGGLADTVFDLDGPDRERGNGFVFEGIDEKSFESAFDRAVRHFYERPHAWLELVAKVMQIDNSWNKSATEYIALYNSIRVG